MRSDMKELIIDIEADGLLLGVKNIWVVVCKFVGANVAVTFTTPSGLQELLDSADVIIGHNAMMYDLPALKKVWGITYDPSKVYDTLLVSRLLLPDRLGKHSLGAWGKTLGIPKTTFSDWSKYSDEMLEYCKQDVNVAEAIYIRLKSDCLQYPKIQRAIQLEHKFANLICYQIQAGFKLDIKKAQELLGILDVERGHIKEELKTILPKQKIIAHYKTIKGKGQLLAEDEQSYTYQTANGKLVTKEFEFKDMNPNSTQQLIAFFKSKGWVPKEFTEKKTPKLDSKILNSLPYPEAKPLARVFRLTKMMGMINDGKAGWLKLVNPETSRIHGDMLTNATNTGRASHNKPNVGQVDKKDLRMRECWIAEEGRVLVDCDASGLELRLLGHYLAPYDKGAFAYEVIQGDIHTFNQHAMGLEKRDSSKSLIYALVYGAGNEKLGKLVYQDKAIHETNERRLKSAGRDVRNSVETNITGYKELVDMVSMLFKQRGFLYGLDGRPLHPRSDYSALNLLIQSAGAIIMKQALTNTVDLLTERNYKLGVDYLLVGNVHDEIIIETSPSIAEEIGKCVKDAIKKAGEDFSLHTTLDGEYKIGKSWAEVH
jgi:DNA polymerase-1